MSTGDSRKRGRDRLILAVLGSGNSFISSRRFHSSFLITNGKTRLVVDCGPTTLHGLARIGVKPSQVNCVLETHFHGDHMLGLPLLLLNNQYIQAPSGGLTVIGPAGLPELVMGIYGAIYAESARRLSTSESDLVHWKTARHGQVLALPDGMGTVRAFRMDHNPESLGYRIEVNGKVLSFTGDTRWNDHLQELANGADILAIDCTTIETPAGAHLTYREICEHRAELSAGTILLTHLGQTLDSRALSEGFIQAKDGLKIEV